MRAKVAQRWGAAGGVGGSGVMAAATGPPGAAPADLAWGAFSDDPPWVLDLDRITWTTGLAALRAAAAGEVPQLVRPRRVPPGLRVVRVAGRLGAAVAPWALRRRLHRLAPGAPSRAEISR